MWKYWQYSVSKDMESGALPHPGGEEGSSVQSFWKAVWSVPQTDSTPGDLYYANKFPETFQYLKT